MIRLENITKIYPGTRHKALDNLTLEIPQGSTTALIGPSGCGKTTTMRLINRLEDASEGRVWVNGEDITAVDPVQLRRHIGYVIQNVGLFPHMNVADNIATVPRLLGWDRRKTSARIDELLHLVGLDPASDRQRYPAELSGGQRQRVGVARALAADPPVMLMDEPFGAIDPLVRGRLQLEFKQILQRVKKTVVIVTHDLDEAIKMGDRIAIMRNGRLCQYDTPAAILSNPADDFVAAFIGSDAALKLLALTPVRQAMTPVAHSAFALSVKSDVSLKEVLSLMLAHDAQGVKITDDQHRLLGELNRQQLFTLSANTACGLSAELRERDD
ncbi:MULTISPECIES: ABC transporter ATP-binding protein [unclassified Brenneria]|uniref:ABC transporter ATP-binding protein n=1 Tax=unclassified Brenneria TaxID=2634434 RepID=UPI0018F0DFCD|nr:ABC transporter ATP-binding protein [Brenneria sp. L3-3C-1]MBJ7222206.1 ABC transporter ATP-binding protein [Brenneria sp. L3-3C-1]MEE3643449.1 ABC transporter ATP-binding protein [Brenneria sp. L3_3C_1]